MCHSVFVRFKKKALIFTEGNNKRINSIITELNNRNELVAFIIPAIRTKTNPRLQTSNITSETLYNSNTSDFPPTYLLPRGAPMSMPERKEKRNNQITIKADSP